MKKQANQGYSVSITFRPGVGFFVVTTVDGDRYETPDAFISLEHAARFAAKHLNLADFVTNVDAQ